MEIPAAILVLLSQNPITNKHVQQLFVQGVQIKFHIFKIAYTGFLIISHFVSANQNTTYELNLVAFIKTSIYR